jgi:hypothetical protein
LELYIIVEFIHNQTEIIYLIPIIIKSKTIAEVKAIELDHFNLFLKYSQSVEKKVIASVLKKNL